MSQLFRFSLISELNIDASLVLLTPLADTLSYIRKDNKIILVAAGNTDRYLDSSILCKKCEEENILYYIEPDVGHRMEVKGDLNKNLNTIKNVIRFAAPSAFAVYILNNNMLVWQYIMDGLFINIANSSLIKLVIYPLGFSILFTIVSIFIDKIRVVITNKETGGIYHESIEEWEDRTDYRGIFEFVEEKEGFVVINELPIEEYLYSVVSAEMPANYEIEALKAQAVVARTYALKRYTTGI